MKKIKLDCFFIIEMCVLFLFGASFLFLLQEFADNSQALGVSILSFNGYEIIFGTIKQSQTVYPNAEPTYVRYHGHPLSGFAFFALILGGIIQVVIILLKLLKCQDEKAMQIMNLVSAILIIVSGIISFFSISLFKIANSNTVKTEFSAVGVTTYAIDVLTCGIVASFNSIDLFIKKSKTLNQD